MATSFHKQIYRTGMAVDRTDIFTARNELAHWARISKLPDATSDGKSEQSKTKLSPSSGNH